MKNLTYLISILGLTLVLSSCNHSEDPGPLQEGEKEYAVIDFSRLEMGDAFVVSVVHGNFFEIKARGDRRNLDDLEVFKDGSTLVIRYDRPGRYNHTTYIDITMPVLESVNFSGASQSTIEGFDQQDEFDLILSGASTSQVEVEAETIELTVSGASTLWLTGVGSRYNADVSGASGINAFDFEADHVVVNASGASEAKVLAITELKATATGSSVVLYRGNPVVDANTSGASSVVSD